MNNVYYQVIIINLLQIQSLFMRYMERYGIAEVSKNLVRYRSENNFIESK